MKKRTAALALAAALLLSLASPAMAASEGPPAWLTGDGMEFGQVPLAQVPETEEDPDSDTGQEEPPSDLGSGLETPSEEDQDAPSDPEFPQVEEPDSSAPAANTPSGLTLVTDQHVAYISGSSGYFNPQGNITRAEAAQILCRLLPEGTAGRASFEDVPEDAWYAQAANTLGALGVMRAGEATFQPDEQLTRGEFIRTITSFFPVRSDADQFSDVSPSDPNAASILTARAWGWLAGFDDGTVRPSQNLTRAEAVTMLNRALGRSPDTEYIDRTNPVFYLDMSRENWFFYDVVEASAAHQHVSSEGSEYWLSHTPVPAALPTGFQLIDGWLCYYDGEKNDFIRSGSMGSFTFDASGHFTTGNAELDGRLREIVLTKTTSEMDQEEKLRALYIYTRDSFTYLRRPAYEFGATGFMEKDALNMLQTGYGNCYCYASLFWYLSRWIGYDSIIYSGTVGSNRAPHSWVEIAFDGKYYIFDTELEMAYHKKGRYEINLYKYIDVDGWLYRRP